MLKQGVKQGIILLLFICNLSKYLYDFLYIDLSKHLDGTAAKKIQFVKIVGDNCHSEMCPLRVIPTVL